jgi:hypothetical protein
MPELAGRDVHRGQFSTLEQARAMLAVVCPSVKKLAVCTREHLRPGRLVVALAHRLRTRSTSSLKCNNNSLDDFPDGIQTEWTTKLAEVAEWQTRWTQNPVPARACGFKSHLRYFDCLAAIRCGTLWISATNPGFFGAFFFSAARRRLIAVKRGLAARWIAAAAILPTRCGAP